MPNWTIYQRESRLYADIEAYQDEALNWNSPASPYTGFPPLDSFVPPALRVAASMEQFGMFTMKGCMPFRTSGEATQAQRSWLKYFVYFSLKRKQAAERSLLCTRGGNK
jgi:hypothetical protein